MLEAVMFLPHRSQRSVAFRSMLPLVAKDSANTWVHLTVDGTYEGHHAGSFTFDRSTSEELIANFNSQKNPIPLTYEHPRYDDGQPKPAAGWVHELEHRDGGLWGLCEFTSRAAQMCRDGEYKFTSVVVVFDSTDRVSGEPVGAELIEVALTNRPFIDGQKPIALSRRSLSMGDIDIKAVFKALGLDPDASPERALEILGHALKLKSAQEAPKDKAPATESTSLALGADAPGISQEAPAAPAAPADDSAAAQSLLAKLIEITGKDAAGVVAFIEENSDGLSGKQSDSGTQIDDIDDKNSPARYSLLEGTVKTLTARLEALESEKTAKLAASRKSEAEGRVKLAVEMGRIADTDAAKWVSLAATAPAQFDDLISTLVPHVPTAMLASRTMTEPVAFTAAGDEEEIKLYMQTLRAAGFKDPVECKAIAVKDLKRRRNGAANGRA